MRKYFPQQLFIVAIILLITSCGKKAPNEAKYIPKNVSMVVAINPKSLEEKLKTGNLTFDSITNRILSNDKIFTEENKKKWEDFKNSGIDLENNFYYFMTQKGSLNADLRTTINIMAVMKDEAKFDKFIREQKDINAADIEKSKDFSIVKTGKDVVMSWNKEVVILSITLEKASGTFDESGNYIEPDLSAIQSKLISEVKSYYSLKENESIASVSYFKDMFKDKADGYMFSTTSGVSSLLSSSPFNIPKLQELVEGNYSTSTFNFENGKIDVKSKSYLNPFLSSLVKKYGGKEVNEDFVENFPSQNMNGALLISFNPELLDALLKELEIRGMVDGFLSKEGLTSADIFKVLKGEINFALSDFSLTTKEVPYNSSIDGTPSTYSTTVPSYKLIFEAPVGDKAAFEKIMNKGVEMNLLTKTTTGYEGGEMINSTGMYFMADDKKIVLASDKEFYNTYLAKKTKSNISSDILKKFDDKTIAAYIDFNSIINGMLPSIKDSTVLKGMNIVNGTFTNLVSTVEKFDGKSMNGKFEINMKNSKQNSLVSFVNMLSDIFKVIKEDDKSRNEIIAD